MTSFEQKCYLDSNVGPVTIIQVYLPGSSYDDDEIENFYDILQ